MQPNQISRRGHPSSSASAGVAEETAALTEGDVRNDLEGAVMSTVGSSSVSTAAKANDTIGIMRDDGFTPIGVGSSSNGSASHAGSRQHNQNQHQHQHQHQHQTQPRQGSPAVGGRLMSSVEIEDDDSHKVRHWKRSRYAVGLVETTWREEILGRKQRAAQIRRSKGCLCCCGECCAACEDSCREDTEAACCCLMMSGMICPLLGARRIGNMVVLKESVTLKIDSDEEDEEYGYDDDLYEEGEEDGEQTSGTRRYNTKIDCVVGPYWPVLLCLTYPLVYGVSLATLVRAIPYKHPLVVVLWSVFTGILCWALFSVSCRDPGIMRRRRRPPPGNEGARWRWSDSALTYRPRGAVYDTDCACVVEEYDHVCPWTGTAIGKKNMPAFKTFVGFVFICLIMDIMLLTGAL